MADLVVLGFDSRHEAEEVFELGASLHVHTNLTKHREKDLIRALQS